MFRALMFVACLFTPLAVDAQLLAHGCTRYDDWVLCEPTQPELSSPEARRYAISEAIIGAPTRERAFLVLLNSDELPRYTQVDVTIPGQSTTYRLLRFIPALSRDVIALDEDPVFAGKITACSIIVTFERAGHTTLVIRPIDLWSGETIVSGVRID